MPKSKPSSHQSPRQSPLFRREIPQMPESYYSSGPNPNLRRFVEEHSHPYDPSTDDYNVPPFDQPITTTKATAIYNMHTYWSKKPHDAIRQYIRHYTKPGDLVLDPFCGSGGTALAALMEGRAAVAIDLSPAATFITKNYCTPVDVDELQRAFEDLKAKVKPEMDWLYETRCDRCDGRATTAYTVYSYIFECSKCGARVPLFDCPEVQVAGKDGKPKAINVCPECHARRAGDPEEYEISTRTSKRFDPVTVLVSYLCQEGCKPQRGERRHNDRDPKKRAFFQQYDLGKLAEIEKKPVPYWFPSNRMMNAPESQEQWGTLYRSGVASYQTVDKVYTKRNIWALALLLNFLPGNDTVRFSIHSIFLNSSKLYRHRESGGGGPAGNISIAQIFREMSVPHLLISKESDLLNGFSELVDHLKSAPCLISTESSTDLNLPPNSIDYIFTDPPYSDTFPYGELNFIWESWMGFNTHWHQKEVIVNPFQGKSELDWAELFSAVMQKSYEGLKPGRRLSLCYHDTSEGTWQLVQDVMASIGFIPEKSEQTLFIDTDQKAFKQLVAEKVTKRDLIINFRKPTLSETHEDTTLITGEEDERTFFDKARLILIEALEAHPGSTADRLYDELVSRMVRQGSFQRHNFDELLRSVAEPVREPVMQNLFDQKTPDLFGSHETVRWYLLDTAGHVDEAEGRKESAAAARLEAFMQGHLKAHPSEPGVHYSDLFEQYLPVVDKPRRRLQDWLPEYFYKTDEGTWRPPRDDEERQAKLGLRSSGVLRGIKRFVAALVEGAPPSERDKPANPATLADWIYQCRRAGLYELGRVLYEKGGLRFDGLGEEIQMQVEEDYQICVKRGSSPSGKKTAKKSPVQPRLDESE